MRCETSSVYHPHRALAVYENGVGARVMVFFGTFGLLLAVVADRVDHRGAGRVSFAALDGHLRYWPLIFLRMWILPSL